MSCTWVYNSVLGGLVRLIAVLELGELGVGLDDLILE